MKCFRCGSEALQIEKPKLIALCDRAGDLGTHGSRVVLLSLQFFDRLLALLWRKHPADIRNARNAWIRQILRACGETETETDY